MPGGLRQFVRHPLGQRDPLGHVQPAELPRLQEFGHVVVEQPVVEERLVLLVGQVRLDDGVEEFGVFLAQEEVQLVAGELRVEGSFFFDLQLRPLQQERELGELRIFRKRGVQRVDFGQAVVGFEAAPGGVLELELFADVEDRHLFLLGEVQGRIQPLLQAQVGEEGGLLGQGGAAGGGVQRVAGDHVDHSVRAELFHRHLHYAVFVGGQVHRHGTGVVQEIEVGTVRDPGNPGWITCLHGGG